MVIITIVVKIIIIYFSVCKFTIGKNTRDTYCFLKVTFGRKFLNQKSGKFCIHCSWQQRRLSTPMEAVRNRSHVLGVISGLPSINNHKQHAIQKICEHFGPAWVQRSSHLQSYKSIEKHRQEADNKPNVSGWDTAFIRGYVHYAGAMSELQNVQKLACQTSRTDSVCLKILTNDNLT